MIILLFVCVVQVFYIIGFGFFCLEILLSLAVLQVCSLTSCISACSSYVLNVSFSCTYFYFLKFFRCKFLERVKSYDKYAMFYC